MLAPLTRSPRHACPRDARATTPSPVRSLLPDSARPSLKRQATAPVATQARSPKKPRVFSDGEPIMWSEEVHAAFLEALQTHPPDPTWRTDVPHTSTATPPLTDYYNTLQDFIYSKTGQPQTVEQISELVARTCSISQTLEVDGGDSSCNSPSYISQLYGSPIPSVSFPSSSPSTHSTASASDAPSMSRRRRASNRPILNLQLDIPSMTTDSSTTPSLTTDASTPVDIPADTPLSALGRLPAFFFMRGASGGSNPITPVEQRIKTPLAPPEIPRMIDTRSQRDPGRWLPTPTEGVLPVLSHGFANPFLAGVEGTAQAQSNGAEKSRNHTRRPSLMARSLSWLSYRSTGSSADANRGASLSSPLAMSSASRPFHEHGDSISAHP